MATLFLDTSALVRRYFQFEPGANQVREVCHPLLGNRLLVSRLTAVEVASALNRRVREGTLPAVGRNRRLRLFNLHWQDEYEVVDLVDTVYDEAARLVTRFPLRTLDALQLASALGAAPRSRRGALTFWTADAQQAAAARVEGLNVRLVG